MRLQAHLFWFCPILGVPLPLLGVSSCKETDCILFISTLYCTIVLYHTIYCKSHLFLLVWLEWQPPAAAATHAISSYDRTGLLVYQLIHSSLLDWSQSKPVCAHPCSLVPPCNWAVLNRDQNLSLYFLLNVCFSILMCFSMHLRITGVLGGRGQRYYLSTYATLKIAQTPAH